ncbi:hypothetical protein AB1M95_03985 [Sulfitobacter sp. LCG007]
MVVVSLSLLAYLAWTGDLQRAGGRVGDLVFGPDEQLPGLLSIEPPQLYTRERLVNDRFRQANWLETQLEYTSDLKVMADMSRASSVARSVDKIEMSIDAGPGANISSAVEEAHPTGAGATEANSGEENAERLASASQRLDEVMKLRLKLRNELMDTLLDDGHDLDGNTLYRLNFDAVVMPFPHLRRYPGTAVFLIEARDPYMDLERTQDQPAVDLAGSDPSVMPSPASTAPGSANAMTTAADERSGDAARGMHIDTSRRQLLEENQIADDIELLRSWQREIQLFLTRVVDARVDTFSRSGGLFNPVDPKEDIALDWYLRQRLIKAFLGAVVYDPEVQALCRAQGLIPDGPPGFEGVGDKWGEGCRDWVAKTVDLDTAPSTSVDGEKEPPAQERPLTRMIEGGFHKAIQRAQYVNAVRDVEGRRLDCELNPRRGPDGKPLSPAACIRYPAQEDSKRAIIRLITVWQEMERFGKNGILTTTLSGAASNPANSRAIPETEADYKVHLLRALGRYDAALPTEDDIADLRAGFRTEGPAAAGDSGHINYLKVADRSIPLRPLSSPGERCSPDPAAADPTMLHYECLMLTSEASFATRELIAEFVLARLKEELEPYDRQNRSIRDFLSVDLAGCRITGCQIEVSQHDDLPLSFVFGGSSMGFMTEEEVGQDADKLRVKCEHGLLGNMIYQFSGSQNVETSVVRLDNCGLEVAKQLVAASGPMQSGLEAAGTLPQLSKLMGVTAVSATDAPAISIPATNRQNERKRCLDLAGRYADLPEARTEIYLACTLRYWVDTQRSDVTVYGVSPRAGDGDDLTQNSRVASSSYGARAGVPLQGSGQAKLSTDKAREQILSNPNVIGLSYLPGLSLPAGSDERPGSGDAVDSARFGWVVRPRYISDDDGYQASHHRLSAVISLPSWWKRVEFRVQACWVRPEDAAPLIGRSDVGQGEVPPYKICEHGAIGRDRGTSEIQIFEIKLPRRVDEITTRFNFDFIKAPYFFREFNEMIMNDGEALSLEAGRSGKLVLQGERLWRGTVVTVNNQPADSILVMPDMKGVIAHFDCVRPPDGKAHVIRAFSDIQIDGEPLAAPREAEPARVPLFVWTSEGSTRRQEATVYPFVQRWQSEKPCWLSDEASDD